MPFPRLLITAFAPALVFSMLGCGDSADTDDAGGGAGTTSGTTSTSEGGSGGATQSFVMQPHPPFPTLAGDRGFVIASPKLVSITFTGDPNTAALQTAGDAIVKSKWVTDVGADYGVGTGTHLAKVVLPETVPVTLTEPDLLALLDQHIKSGLVPPPAADVIHVIYIPLGTAYEDIDGYPICSDFYGYHWQSDTPSGTLTYAIVGDCGDGLDEVTATLSHEYIETASDPGFEGGYYLQLAKSDPWYSVDGLENADLCDYAGYVVEDGLTYQRVWSNSRAAAAVTSPCAPIDSAEVFFNVFSDATAIPDVAAGSSMTFTLTGWSAAPVPDWQLDFDAAYYSEFTPGVELSSLTINNGKTVTLKMTVPAGTPPGRLGTAMMYSGDGEGRFWPVSVRSK